jgi:hypothetical protein
VFETYAGTQIGLDKIAQRLEEAGHPTKTGKRLWRRSFLKTMLSNETYLAVKYFNTVRCTMRCVREYANPIYDNVYASGDFSRDAYVRKNRELDAIVESLRTRSKELEGRAASLGKRQLTQFELCANSESVRQFLLDHLEKVVLLNDRVTLHRRIPFGTTGDQEHRLPFSISSEITREERSQDRRKMGNAAAHSPSVAQFIRDRTTSPQDRVASASR